MKTKTSVVVICVEAIIYLLLHNLHECTFNDNSSIIPCSMFLTGNLVKTEVNEKWIRHILNA